VSSPEVVVKCGFSSETCATWKEHNLRLGYCTLLPSYLQDLKIYMRRLKPL
jgi:hypothetical protein